MSNTEAPRKTGRLIPEALFDPKNPPESPETREVLAGIEAENIVRRAKENTHEGLVAFLKRTTFDLNEITRAYYEARGYFQNQDKKGKK